MLEQLKQEICVANRTVAKLENGFLLQGSAAGIDRETGYIVIRPSGATAEDLRPETMLVVREDGTVLEGEGSPAGDLAMHRELFHAFGWITASAHAHSHFAVCFAQAGRSIPPYGASHADHFCGEIPCIRELTPREIASHYEKHLGQLIAESFRYADEQEVPGVLVARHGGFVWGNTPQKATQHLVGLEAAAHTAFDTEVLNGQVTPAGRPLLEKHFYRRHSSSSLK